MEDIQIVAFILGFALRIIGIFVCSSKAAELNRNSTSWGFFGFFMPIVAMIIIHNSKPKIDWHEEWGQTDESIKLSDDKQISKPLSSYQDDEKKYEILRKLKELFDSGILTQNEFDKEKQKILGN